MEKILKKAFVACCSFGLVLNFLQATTFEDQKKGEMIRDLEVIKHHFETGYAPSAWKKEYIGWDLNESFEQAKNQVLATPSITTKQFQQIVRQFVNSMKDYHVDVLFFSTESASLPFSIRGIEGRYFIDWVDALRLPVGYYGIRAGDELLEFDGHPVANLVTALKRENGKSANESTDQAIAEMKLTLRSGMMGDIVPKGPILITTRSSKTKKVMTHQLRWSYTPEHVRNPLDFLETTPFLFPFYSKSEEKQLKIEFPSITMANPVHEAFAQKYAERSGGLGSRRSFIPDLGEVIWSSDKEEEGKNAEEKKETASTKKKKTAPWHAYIYRHANGRKIGYIRIPHYVGGELSALGKILKMMEEETEALVIDQVHNFGGYVHVQYAVTSMLTNSPLQTPYHRIKITQKEALRAHQTLELIKMLEMAADLQEDSSDSDSDRKEGEDTDKNKQDDDDDDDDFGINFQEILFLKAYCELILEDWDKGQTLTRPTPILGVDRINPHPKYQYTKPILMLINEMDFSGADFMPATLQDNHRAVLFGARTAGAGGYVFKFEFPNTHGIALCSYTASLAERANLQKIENVGVSPDIAYQVTLEDVQNGYAGYIQAVNQSVHTLLGSPEPIVPVVSEEPVEIPLIPLINSTSDQKTL